MRAADTSPEAHRVQLAIWQRMGNSGTADLSIRMSEEARQITMAGIRSRHPEYDDESVRHAFFRLTFGDELFRAAWPTRPLLEP